MKKTSILTIVVAIFFSVVFGAWAQGGFQAPQPFKKSGSNWLMNSATEHLGSSVSRIAKIWTTDLDATNLVIGGTSAGNLNMGGFNISNAGSITGTTLSATSTTATSTITNALGIGTSTPASLLHVSAGASATTTVDFGGQAVTAKTCFNVRNNTGAATSFYFVGTTLVIEAKRCI